MAPERIGLLQGTSHLLILKTLERRPTHGLGIARRIEQVTRGTFQIKPGTLFPALYRIEKQGWVISSWGTSENHRRARYYKLTNSGRRQIEMEAGRWRQISLAVNWALGES